MTLKVVIVYASRTGETKEIAVCIAQGIHEQGIQADIFDISQVMDENHLRGYDGYVFGSSIYGEEILPEMRNFLGKISQLDFNGKVGGAFGSYEWNEVVPDRIYEIMDNIMKMDMVKGSLKLKPPLLGHKEQEAKDYGRSIAEKIIGLNS